MRRAASIAFALFCLVCLAAVTWPGMAWFGGGELVLGLPLSLAWNVGWVAASFVALAVFHRVTSEEDE